MLYLTAPRFVVVLRLVNEVWVCFFVHAKAIVHYLVFALAQATIHILNLGHRCCSVRAVPSSVGSVWRHFAEEKEWRYAELITHTRCVVPTADKNNTSKKEDQL